MKSADRHAVLAILELVASEQGPWLHCLLDALSYSPLRYVIVDLSTRWQVQDVAELTRLVRKTAHDLDRLEKRPIRWRHPREIVAEPHLGALNSLVQKRSERADTDAEKRRLEIIGRKIERLYSLERQRRRLDAFLREPSRPVSPDWIRSFLKQPR